MGSWPIVPCLELVRGMTTKHAKLIRLVKMSSFLAVVMRIVRRGPLKEVDSAPHIVVCQLYAKMVLWFADFVITLLLDNGVVAPLRNGCSYSELALRTNQTSPFSPLRNMTVARSFEAITFLNFLSGVTSVEQEIHRFVKLKTTGIIIGLCLQLVCIAGRLIFVKCGFRHLSSVTAPGM